MKTLNLIVAVLVMFLCDAGGALRLDGDKAWLSAESLPVSGILAQFEHCGVEVFLDPSLSFDPISGEWKGVDAERMIQQIVEPHNYLIEWQRTQGPLGAFYRIHSLRIFADGNRAAAEPFSPGRVLDVVQGTNGVEYLRGEMMVAFKEGATEKDLAALLEGVGGTLVDVIDPPGIYRIRIQDGLSVEEAQARIAEMDAVDRAEPNYAYRQNGTMPSDKSAAGRGVNLQLQPGEGAVAVFDTGLDPKYAEYPLIRGTYNAVDPDRPISDPDGHGTLMAMVASGAVVPEGAAPRDEGSAVFAVRVLDENGYTSSDILLDAIHQVSRANVPVINMSFGSEVDSQFMEYAIDLATQRGITVVASAGNKPTGRPVYPAAYDNVIAVGGVNPDGTPWEKSNYGDFVDVVAPAYVAFEGKMYQGTSPAAADVSGRMAAGK